MRGIVPRLVNEDAKIAALLTKQNIEKFKKGSNTRFYDVTYPLYVKEFAALQKDAPIPSWGKRIGMVYSWIPGISNQAFQYHEDMELVKKDARLMTELAECFQGELLEKSKIDVVNPQEKYLLRIGNGSVINMKEKVQPLLGRLMHGNENVHTQIATNSKMLHFIAPHLFPILDANICRTIFGKKSPRLSDYMDYMYLVKGFLEDDVLTASLADKSVSKLYIIDGVLFNSQ